MCLALICVGCGCSKSSSNLTVEIKLDSRKPSLTPQTPFCSELIIFPLSHHRALTWSIPWAVSRQGCDVSQNCDQACLPELSLPSSPPSMVPSAQEMVLKNKQMEELRGFYYQKQKNGQKYDQRIFYAISFYCEKPRSVKQCKVRGNGDKTLNSEAFLTWH